MTQPKPIQTVSRAMSGVSPWYIKGSYVLDVVFRDRLGPVQHAADLDVFYLKGQGKPNKSDIEPVLQAAGLPPLPPKGIHGPFDVDDLSALDGVGRPVFNIDLWHIREDGSLKTRNQAGAIVPLPLDSPEIAGPLRLLPGEQPNSKQALKGLMKMAFYPPLYDRRLVRVLARLVEADLP